MATARQSKTPFEKAMTPAKPKSVQAATGWPHKNLGTYLHPKKKGRK